MHATNRTATIAGVWSAAGLVPFGAWIEEAEFGSVLMHDLAWLSGVLIFFFLPTCLFVIGRNAFTLSHTWVFNPKEHAEFWNVVKRMLAWFIGAGATFGFFAAVS
jgi:hypothetical protein